MRLGGPLFEPVKDPNEWITELRKLEHVLKIAQTPP
jgi:hypothetical protein